MVERRGTPDTPKPVERWGGAPDGGSAPPGPTTGPKSGTSLGPAARFAPTTPGQVSEYLGRNPDFLLRHPDLLAILTPPALRSGGNVIDMQRFMVQRLQADLSQLRGQHRSLLGTARAQQSDQARVHAAVLALMAARSFEQAVHIVTHEFAIHLDVDLVMMCVETDSAAGARPPYPGVRLMRIGTAAALFAKDKGVALDTVATGEPAIFGAGAGLVRSQALLRLAIGRHAPPAFLALGARRATRFKPAQSSELLSFLARSIEITIAQWLMLEP